MQKDWDALLKDVENALYEISSDADKGRVLELQGFINALPPDLQRWVLRENYRNPNVVVANLRSERNMDISGRRDKNFRE